MLPTTYSKCSIRMPIERKMCVPLTRSKIAKISFRRNLIAKKWIHAIPINNNIYYLENYRINLYLFGPNFNKMLFSIYFCFLFVAAKQIKRTTNHNDRF